MKLRQTDLRQIETCIWEIPASVRRDMHVPARIVASDALLADMLADDCLTQLVNTATLPGITRYALAAPDAHSGYGAPVGGIIAMDMNDEQAVISPGVTGYDINCGVRLLTSNLQAHAIRPYLKTLLESMYRTCPSGTGDNSRITLKRQKLEDILRHGSQALDATIAPKEDSAHTESNGCLPGADPSHVSERAFERGYRQLGTLGAGNHFLEIGRVAEIPDEAQAVARTFGLVEDQVVVFIHTGSRGLGHQVATDYIKSHQHAVDTYGIALADRQLVCAPVHSPEGKAYLAAMRCAANFAFANRQMLTALVREAFEQVLLRVGVSPTLRLLYDLAHNITKVEQHTLDGIPTKLLIHRKGSTRAFGPDHADVPPAYRAVGQPVLLPGSMGTASYVLVGTNRAMQETFGSCAHGAGRRHSRTAMRKKVQGQQVRQSLTSRGILVQSGSVKGLAEEAPEAYKDVDLVIDAVERSGIARVVARLEPLGVVKG